MKFHDELRWCVTQLELGLARQDPDSRQTAETVKILKILKSSKAPLVKKRQAMRSALGDYRKKMKESEKKFLSGLRNSKFQPAANTKAHTKSKFLKQSHSRSVDREELGSQLSNLQLQQQDFRQDNSSSGKNVAYNSIQGEKLGFASTALPETSCGRVDSAVVGDVNNHLTARSLNTSPAQLKPSSCAAALREDPNQANQGKSCSSAGADGKLFSSEKAVGKSGHCGFHFQPSDNSFSFCFSEEEGAHNETEGGSGDAGVLSERAEDSCNSRDDSVKPNMFKYERTDNSFIFNFSVDGDKAL